MSNREVPGAQIDFKPDMGIEKVLNKLLLPLDDSQARKEWGWRPAYDQERGSLPRTSLNIFADARDDDLATALMGCLPHLTRSC